LTSKKEGLEKQGSGVKRKRKNTALKRKKGRRGGIGKIGHFLFPSMALMSCRKKG